jgi:hypothetical protein
VKLFFRHAGSALSLPTRVNHFMSAIGAHIADSGELQSRAYYTNSLNSLLTRAVTLWRRQLPFTCHAFAQIFFLTVTRTTNTIPLLV